jgi:hypothetical protein
MNERPGFDWRLQAARMCNDLADTFTFLAKVNNELVKPRETGENVFKAIKLTLKANAFIQEATKQPTPTD